jgi:catalase-peroxidase
MISVSISVDVPNLADGVRFYCVLSNRGKQVCPPSAWRRSDAQRKFIEDFVAAWNKVMNLDRVDLA